MKTTFYLIRHGETEYNAQSRLQGHTDIPLNDIGRKQAEDLAKELETTHFDALYSSPLSRARSTADILSEHLHLPVQIIEELRERKLGDLEGKSKEEMLAQYPDWGKMSEEERWTDEREHTESAKHTSERILQTLKSIAKEKDGQTIAIVTHGGNIRFTLIGLAYGTMNSIRGIKNCGYAVITFDDADFIVEKVEKLREAL